MPNLHIIWDFDAAIGQINATFPYNYREAHLYEEIENVERILKLAKRYDIRFTFAITGFTAEEGIYPYHLPDLIQRIHQDGHEIASHTWRHEWLPIIQHRQILKTLERSKYALEKCLGVEGAVQGLVPPHNRPMSWYRKGAFSLGDRGVYPFFKGADLGSMIKIAGQCGYSWVRVAYRPLVEKLAGRNKNHSLERKWAKSDAVLAVPLNYNGFGPKAIELANKAVQFQKDLVLSGHPLMLSRGGKSESEENLVLLLDHVKTMDGKIVVTPVNQNPNFQSILEN